VPQQRREPQLDRLVTAMLVNLGAGLVVAAAIFLAHNEILNGLPANGSTRDSLSWTLWTRPAPSIAVALLYPLFIRRLRQHQRRGYRRVVIVAVLQLAALAWYATGAGYPLWLRLLQGGQGVVVLVVLWLATRPELRALFGYARPGPEVRQGRRAAALLFLLAPVIAELTWGSTRASQLLGLLLFLPVYGAGALLIRELARRHGRGPGTVLLLGAAYGLVEEGLSLQSLTSPTLYPSMVGLAPRLAGVNPAYTVMVLTYHAVFSIGIPIALAELANPAVRRRPWLRRPGLVGTGVVALLGFGLVRLIPLTADPHYLMPWPVDVLLAVLVAAVVGLAFRVRFPRPAPAPRAPSTAVVAGTAFLGTVGFLGLLMPLPGARHAGYAPTAATAWVAIGVAVALGALTVLVAARWFRAPGWTGAHTAAALAAALVGHTAIGLLTLVHTPLDRVALAAFGVVELVLLLGFYRRQRSSPAGEGWPQLSGSASSRCAQTTHSSLPGREPS
jgi:hypothetical protein